MMKRHRRRRANRAHKAHIIIMKGRAFAKAATLWLFNVLEESDKINAKNETNI